VSKSAKLIATRSIPLEWGVASRALPGEDASGDACIVQECDGRVLVAVVDALGHGAAAAATASLAAETLRLHAGEPIQFLVKRCHDALLGTRGAVVSVASIDHREGTMAWLGVGDIEGVLAFADPSAVPTHSILTTLGGIVGGRLPSIRPWFIPVAPGDTLVFTTDGIRSGIAASVSPSGAPQALANQILARGFKGTDDALVLVARLRRSPEDDQ
jgi:negative regulator of sigma-B (phosphoserine phosphatase)